MYKNIIIMGKFKTLMTFTKGERLLTTKGELTNWTFLDEATKNSKTGRRYIKAKCSCGREKTICVNNIRNGTSTSCGFYPCRSFKKEKDPEVGYRAIQYVYKKHAKERDLSYDLDYETFKQLVQKDCHYCGVEPLQVYQLKNPKTGEIRSGIPILYNGIDRVDSSKGYFKDNVVPCCKVCNRAKSDLSLAEFKDWIIKLYNKTID